MQVLSIYNGERKHEFNQRMKAFSTYKLTKTSSICLIDYFGVLAFLKQGSNLVSITWEELEGIQAVSNNLTQNNCSIAIYFSRVSYNLPGTNVKTHQLFARLRDP